MDTQKFEQSFKQLLPKKRLLAVRLDGFSHSAWYDDGNKNSQIEQLWFSGCVPESPNNTPISKTLLGQYPHYCYQGSPYGNVWIAPSNR